MLTKEQERRVIQSIQECDAFIAREDARDANLRPADVQKVLDHYKAHRQKLIDMLAAQERAA